MSLATRIAVLERGAGGPCLVCKGEPPLSVRRAGDGREAERRPGCGGARIVRVLRDRGGPLSAA
jgi:hypothetical protein